MLHRRGDVDGVSYHYAVGKQEHVGEESNTMMITVCNAEDKEMVI